MYDAHILHIHSDVSVNLEITTFSALHLIDMQLKCIHSIQNKSFWDLR